MSDHSTASSSSYSTVAQRSVLASLILVLIVIASIICSMAMPAPVNRLPPDSYPVHAGPVPPVSESRCVECHEDQVARFASAPHHNTLVSGSSDLAARRLDGRRFVDPETGHSFEYAKAKDGYVWLHSSRRATPLRVDWLFGSGHHACTPVSLIDAPDGLQMALEHVMSWYPDDTIGWTLGINAEFQNLPGVRAVCNPNTPQQTRECFQCHTTWLPEDTGRPDYHRQIPNVICTRCHMQAAAHLADPEYGSLQRWADLTPLESVNRCGQCHRRADQMTADELVPQNKLLVRFASVALVMSECFRQQQADRMDCMVCHDPHEPASADPRWYNARCANCHTAEKSQICSFRQTSDQCISCHMPKVRMQDGLFFTDHWIRPHSPTE